MTDDNGPNSITEAAGEDASEAASEDAGDGWVEPNGSGHFVRHVPGLYDIPETTYVAPVSVPLRQRTIVVASAIVLASIAIGGGFVLAADSKGSTGGGAEVSAAATLTSTSTRPPGTSTTTTPARTDSAAPVTSPATEPESVGGATDAPAAAPASPLALPAIANPAFNPYTAIAVPTGVSASLTSCSWQTASGGELQSAGIVTSHDGAARTWTLTMVWLQNSRELARTSTAVLLAPSEAKGWSLTLASAPPPDIACALEIS